MPPISSLDIAFVACSTFKWCQVLIATIQIAMKPFDPYTTVETESRYKITTFFFSFQRVFHRTDRNDTTGWI